MKVLFPLFDEIRKIPELNGRFTKNPPVKVVGFPYAFAHTVGKIQEVKSDDEVLLYKQARIGVRLVDTEKKTEEDLRNLFEKIEKLFLEYQSDDILHIHKDTDGQYFDADAENSDTMLEKDFIVKFF